MEPPRTACEVSHHQTEERCPQGPGPRRAAAQSGSQLTTSPRTKSQPAELVRDTGPQPHLLVEWNLPLNKELTCTAQVEGHSAAWVSGRHQHVLWPPHSFLSAVVVLLRLAEAWGGWAGPWC